MPGIGSKASRGYRRRRLTIQSLPCQLAPRFGNVCLGRQSRWPHVAQVGELTRTVRTRTGTTAEVVYLLTTLPSARASPADLLGLARAHWPIENGRHSVRDVTCGEDRSRLRTGHAPQVLAAWRNLALTLIHRTGSWAIAATQRTFAAHPERPFALLLPPTS